MTTIEVSLNRVEGDLVVRAEIADGVVVDAWSSGTMFRGIENLLRGRGALDGLVITPRVCGICTTAHLTAAARALDAVFGVAPPPSALRVRNAALLAEHMQSDLRQAVLMYAADFPSPAHSAEPLHGEAVRRYRPLAGDSVLEAIQATKRLLEIVAILGGQWPHSSFMVPGGVASAPSAVDVARCRQILAGYRHYYERRVLGCTVERFREIGSAPELDAWLDEAPEHRDSEVGFFLRYGRALGLDDVGRGHGNFVTFGGLPVPEGSSVRAPGGGSELQPAGFARGLAVEPFDAALVAEDVAASFYVDADSPRHPSRGETRPYASGREGGKYSWAKAARYAGVPAETGALAEAIVARDPLFTDLVRRARGPTALTRALARLVRTTTLLPALDAWLGELGSDLGPCCHAHVPVRDGEGAGLTQATRGALGHWVAIEGGRIARYQIITPTGWNGSPRDGAGVRGPWEEALVGTRVRDADNPIELGYVVRSFDPCLVCTVHTFDARGQRSVLRFGG